MVPIINKSKKKNKNQKCYTILQLSVFIKRNRDYNDVYEISF